MMGNYRIRFGKGFVSSKRISVALMRGSAISLKFILWGGGGPSKRRPGSHSFLLIRKIISLACTLQIVNVLNPLCDRCARLVVKVPGGLELHNPPRSTTTC